MINPQSPGRDRVTPGASTTGAHHIAGTLPHVDAVALAAVITSGVVGLTGVGAAFWSTHRTAQTAREGRVQQRLAESYLEVLRLVELEAQWATARATNLKIAAEEGFPEVGGRVKVPEPPAVDLRAVIAAHLAAFGSAQVGTLYRAWRERMTAVEDEYRYLDFYWRECIGVGGAIEIDELKRMLDELLPEEAAARKLIAEAMAKDLGHR
jgi:hypothetical protein